MVFRPAASRDFTMAGPTPGSRPTGRGARKLCASAAPITEKPRGLSRSEAILARNLLGARPMETVSPVCASMRAWALARVTAGGAPCRRSVPDRSIQASSSDRGWTSGVSSASRPMMVLLSVLYLAKSGLITTACGQAARALNIGMAERTP